MSSSYCQPNSDHLQDELQQNMQACEQELQTLRKQSLQLQREKEEAEEAKVHPGGLKHRGWQHMVMVRARWELPQDAHHSC